MSNDDNRPFSEREGFSAQLCGMKDLKVIRKIWRAFYQLLNIKDALGALEEIFGVPTGETSIWYANYQSRLHATFDQEPIRDLHRVIAKEWLEKNWITACNEERWFDFYDMCEFLITESSQGGQVADAIRGVLGKIPNAGCRLVEGKFVIAHSPEEGESIETALSGPFAEVRTHMKKAVVLFSDRERPDYANTVKESFSAVESIVKELTGKEVKSGLRQLVKDGILPKDIVVEKDGKSHKVNHLVGALENHWDFASKTSRHGLKSGESPPDEDTAYLILVTCAAVVNYIAARKDKSS